jgi:sarcosine oxidase delta subunit
MSEDIDCEGTDEVVCPYCGYVHSDSWELGGDSGEDRCSGCEKFFSWTRNVSVSYSTSKDCEKNKEEHEWRTKVSFIHADKAYVSCEKCSAYKLMGGGKDDA